MARDRTRRGPAPAAGGSASRPQHSFRVTFSGSAPRLTPQLLLLQGPRSDWEGHSEEDGAGRGGAERLSLGGGKFASGGVSAAQETVSPAAAFESWGREVLGVHEIVEAGGGD